MAGSGSVRRPPPADLTPAEVAREAQALLRDFSVWLADVLYAAAAADMDGSVAGGPGVDPGTPQNWPARRGGPGGPKTRRGPSMIADVIPSPRTVP
jgi:hypothetical protein